MINHTDISNRVVFVKIKNREFVFAGNKNLKIYGFLNCRSGKRMKRENRIFIESEQQALESDYRPCGHCMKRKYEEWKQAGI